MSSSSPAPRPEIDETLRARILAEPESLLDDGEVMRALIAANDRRMGGNIVDLRGLAMDRLEARLGQLEDTHRSVIAAAYDNVAGTNQIHRALLRMMDPLDFESFLGDLGGEVADILRVDAMRLVLESASEGVGSASVAQLDGVLTITEPGFVDHYVTGGRNTPPRQVTLRGCDGASARLYGHAADWIRSEACLKLDLGEGRLPGLLLMGAEDPQLFTPQQGTDLLAFFAGVFERLMRRYLA